VKGDEEMFLKTFSILLAVSVFASISFCQESLNDKSAAYLYKLYNQEMKAGASEERLDEIIKAYRAVATWDKTTEHWVKLKTTKEINEEFPKEKIWKPEMGLAPQDYIKMVLDQWISQLKATEASSRHFYSQQYITLKVVDNLPKNSEIFKKVVSALVDNPPAVANEWCHVPFMMCHYNIDRQNIPAAISRIEYFKRTYLSQENYCKGGDAGVFDASGDKVSACTTEVDNNNSCDEYRTKLRANSLEVCRFSGPVVYGKCMIYNSNETTRDDWHWRLATGTKILSETQYKSDAYKEMLSNIACQSIPGG
jgi:hypothetical protein